MKTCNKCGKTKELSFFSPAYQCYGGYRPECKSCHNEIEKARDKSHRASNTYAYKRRERLGRLFGITPEDYDAMLAKQNGVCAICGGDGAWNRREDLLVVDHCHETKEIRGLLCHACNQGLGLFRDNPKTLLAAIEYLEVKQDEQSDSTG